MSCIYKVPTQQETVSLLYKTERKDLMMMMSFVCFIHSQERKFLNFEKKNNDHFQIFEKTKTSLHSQILHSLYCTSTDQDYY